MENRYERKAKPALTEKQRLKKERNAFVDYETSNKTATFDEWMAAMEILIKKRSIVYPEDWAVKKVSRYVLMSYYNQGKNIKWTLKELCGKNFDNKLIEHELKKK